MPDRKEGIPILPPKNNKKSNKPYDDGYFGSLREKYLQNEHPKLYNALQDTGSLHEYLDGYQRAYAEKAGRLYDKLAKKYHLTPELREADFVEYLKRYAKISEEIRAALKPLIER